MAFITAAIIDAAIGGPTRAKVTDNSQATLLRKIYEADARTRSDLKQAGYTVNPATYNTSPTNLEAPVEVVHASIGHFIRSTFPRHYLSMEGYEEYTEAGPAIARGDLQPDGLDTDPGEGIGAARFTDVDLNPDFEPQFSRDKLRVV